MAQIRLGVRSVLKIVGGGIIGPHVLFHSARIYGLGRAFSSARRRRNSGWHMRDGTCDQTNQSHDIGVKRGLEEADVTKCLFALKYAHDATFMVITIDYLHLQPVQSQIYSLRFSPRVTSQLVSV